MALDAGFAVRIESQRAYVVRFCAARAGFVVRVAPSRGVSRTRLVAAFDPDILDVVRLRAHALFAVARELVSRAQRRFVVASRLDAPNRFRLVVHAHSRQTIRVLVFATHKCRNFRSHHDHKMVRAAVFRNSSETVQLVRFAPDTMAVVFFPGSRRRVCGLETRPRVRRRAAVDFRGQFRRANQLQRRRRRTGEFPVSRLSRNDVVDQFRITRFVMQSATLERAARCTNH